MALFQSSVLKDHLRLQDFQQVDEAYQMFTGVPSSGVEMPQLTKKDEFEWMELFEENKKKALELQQEIEKTDAEIDLMVYELYGLSDKEIAIVS